MSAQVTEAHRALALQIQLECAGDYELDEPTTAQLIADSEAKATDQLRAENERLRRAYVRPDDIRVQLESAIARAERAEAELATERARLDWLMAGGVCMVQHKGGFHVSRFHAPVSRAAIDAAMKEGGT